MASPRKLRPRQAKNTTDQSSPAGLDPDMIDDDRDSVNRLRQKKRKSTAKKVQKAEESSSSESKKKKMPKRVVVADPECRFIGEPVPSDEARKRWPERYDPKVCP
ncbi:hypothetical protein BVC80_1295g9 [Macleaya cordata]|uniref:Uncharacterized protein n=1 Tax=Macleaya cordata TaxID=56857 RepID=A0A200QYU4_MACCD|nr:hypothetical protein BVC80_1295g9 [Macleaya cordata]